MERLQKFLSRAGVASRRHAEKLITDGRVKVNGKVATVLGTQVDAQKDLVLLDGKLVSVNPERRYFLFYKPPGVVTTLSDPEGRPTVGDYAHEAGGRVFPVGRLDYDAEGALLLTDDGELANKLMHPSHQVPRVYLAKVKGAPDPDSLQKLVDGVRLEDGMARAVETRIFDRAQRNTWVKIIVTEGRQHLVKRLFAAIGHPVVRLYRPAHAGISVQGLRPGELRALSHEEIRRVKASADGDQQPEPPLSLPARRHGHAAPGFEPEEDEAAPRPPGRTAEPPRDDAAPRPPRAEGHPERRGATGRAEEPRARSAPRPEPRGDRGREPAPRPPAAGRPDARGERPRFGTERKRFGEPERAHAERTPSGPERERSGAPERSRGGRPFAGAERQRGGAAEQARGERPRFGAERKRFGAPDRARGERPRSDTERRRSGDPSRPRDEGAPGPRRTEGAFGNRRGSVDRPAPPSRPFPGEPGFGRSSPERQERQERRGPGAAKRPDARGGPRRFEGSDGPGGFKRGPARRGPPQGRGGPGGRTSRRKPRGSW